MEHGVSPEGAPEKVPAPVLRVREGLLVLPLSGSIGPPRAQQLREQLLQRVKDDRARIVVLDLTGVPELDPVVANHFVDTVEASRFIGADVLVTGLSVRLTQILVSANVDLTRISLHGDLQGGLDHAEKRLDQAASATGSRNRLKA